MDKIDMLSVIAVNYNSSFFLKRCFSSITSTAKDIRIEFIVVDSGSKKEEADNLRFLEGDNVRTIFRKENIGYSQAVNIGVRNANGDFILITNPDVLYKPGSIKYMMDALRSLPRCGAIGPKTWWDEEMTLLLPPGELITPFRILRAEFMAISRTFWKRVLKNWIKHALRHWLSKDPLTQEMLSGACIMTTRKVLDIVGGFDEAFPLYFEDTDWCLRVRKAGYNLYMLPDAEIIHYYNQSAKQELEVSREKFNTSCIKYLKKHFAFQFKLSTYIRRLFKYANNNTISLYKDMGIITHPPIFRFKGNKRRLVLLSPVETMIPSAGALLDCDSFEIQKGLWRLLARGKYFAMAFEIEGLRDCGAWSWIKD